MPLSSFSLGLDPRVHAINAKKDGCPDKVRAKRGMDVMCPQTLMVSLSNHEGFNIKCAAHPSTSSG